MLPSVAAYYKNILLYNKLNSMENEINKNQFDFTYSFRVRYSEVDSQGIVFNANYLIYFDLGIGEYFRSKGIPYNDFIKQYSVDFHVIRSVIDYKLPAKYDDELNIYIRGEYKGPKIFWFIVIYNNEKLICSGELIYIAIDTGNKKVTNVRPEIAHRIDLPEKTD